MNWIFIIVIISLLIVALFITFYPKYKKASINANSGNFRDENTYKTLLKELSEKYESMREQRQSVESELNTITDMPESERCFVNFYGLGCRFTGYLGPFEEGYFDPQNAVKLACYAGCRVFVLEIDYLDDCNGDQFKYHPQIVVRDIHNRLRIKPNSNQPLCKSSQTDNIQSVCQAIEDNAFNVSSDPVVIVLYFLRQPPGSYKSHTVLEYFSKVAKAISPFQNRLVTNVLEGGSFFRQKQEGRLLINNITDYNNKVLIFSNANTSGFRENNTYQPMEDLDFLVNLRLNYTQTKLGITENLSQGNYGILETVQDYLIIPSDRIEEVADNTKLRWTICLNNDPSLPINQSDYDKVTNNFGVHCIPIQLFSNKEDFIFKDNLFKKFSYIPKPKNLRYIKPPIVIPGEPNPNTDAKQGKLRSPTIGGET
jgi:hypothetical protein